MWEVSAQNETLQLVRYCRWFTALGTWCWDNCVNRCLVQPIRFTHVLSGQAGRNHHYRFSSSYLDHLLPPAGDHKHTHSQRENQQMWSIRVCFREEVKLVVQPGMVAETGLQKKQTPEHSKKELEVAAVFSGQPAPLCRYTKFLHVSGRKISRHSGLSMVSISTHSTSIIVTEQWLNIGLYHRSR